MVAYNFIICSARVVCPRRLLHNLAGHHLKVQQVVASLEMGHAGNALLAFGFLRVEGFFFLLNGCHVHCSQVLRRVQELVQGIGWVDWFELFGRIFACILEDDLLTTGVF